MAKRKEPSGGFSPTSERSVIDALSTIPTLVRHDMKLGCVQLISWLHQQVSSNPASGDISKRLRLTISDGFNEFFTQFSPTKMVDFLARFHVVLHPDVFKSIFDEFQAKHTRENFTIILNSSSTPPVKEIVSVLCDGTVGLRSSSLNALKLFLNAGASADCKESLLHTCFRSATLMQSNLDVAAILVENRSHLLREENSQGNSLFEVAALSGQVGLPWIRFIAEHSGRDENLDSALYTALCLSSEFAVSTDSITTIMALPPTQFKITAEDAALTLQRRPEWFVWLSRKRPDAVLQYLCTPTYDLDSSRATVPEPQVRLVLNFGKELPLEIATRLLYTCCLYRYKRRIHNLSLDAPAQADLVIKDGVTIRKVIHQHCNPPKRQVQVRNVQRTAPAIAELCEFGFEWLFSGPDIQFKDEPGEGFGVFCTWLDLVIDWCFIPSSGIMELLGSEEKPIYNFNPACKKFKEIRLLGLAFGLAFIQKLRCPYRLAGHIYGAILGLQGDRRHYAEMFPNEDHFLLTPLADTKSASLESLVELFPASFPEAKHLPFADTEKMRLKHVDHLINEAVVNRAQSQRDAFIDGVNLILDSAAFASYGETLSCNEKWDLSGIWFAQMEITFEQFKNHCVFVDSPRNTPETRALFWGAVQALNPGVRGGTPSGLIQLFRFITGHSVRPHMTITIHVEFREDTGYLPTVSSCTCLLFMPACSTAAEMKKRLEWCLYNGDSIFGFI